MNKFSKVFAVAAMTSAIAAFAAPSQAGTVIFASFNTGQSNSNNFRFVNTGGDDASLFTTSTAAATTAGAAGVKFSFFDDPSLSDFYNLDALFTLTGSIVDTAATCNGITCTQTGINGSFNFVYNGPTTTIDGFLLTKGVTSLFSGTFNDAWIQGAGGVGGLDVTIANNGLATFTSAYYDFSDLSPGSEEFTLHLGNVNPNFAQADANSALNSFSAHAGGDFQFGVPEPATWALMIMGFGGAGAMLRSQRRKALALV